MNPSREAGFSGYQPLKFTDIAEYIRLFRVAEKADFIHNIYVLDSEYLTIMREKQEKEASAPKKKKGAKK
jgi:hypothetical protein